ncbi:MAG: hypothetical protein L0H84_20405, partial [Pseudonocardia sp.]|nr:hypothetical protein [Pseudonocardia sp.]
MKRGIIGRAGDPQVRSVATRVRALGHEPVLLDLSAFPARTRLGLRDGVPQAGGIDLDDVSYWYVRSLPLPLPFLARTNPASDGDARRAYAAGRERRSFLAGFVAAMQASGATLVNPPQVMA